MLNTSIRLWLVIAVLLIVCAGLIILQIFLSKKEGKWPGLILPIISFGISLTVLAGILLFSAHTGTSTLMVNGEVVERTTSLISDMATIVGMAAYTFLLYNIPTVVLLAIYAACRGKRDKRRALDRMSAQDLE
jgi:ABC-type nickel/cobalt efflux system permease component RcnA